MAQVTVDDLLKIIGSKEVELQAMRSRVAQLEEQLKKESPKEPKDDTGSSD